MSSPNLDPTALRDHFAGQADVQLAYLFGSYARGQAGPLSDVDIAVLLAGDPPPMACAVRREELILDLMGLLRINEVDLVLLNQAPLSLRFRVLRDGKLLFSRDEDRRIEFVSRTVIEYLDIQPLRERHERAIIERAAKGELLHGHNPYRGALEKTRRLLGRVRRAAPVDPTGASGRPHRTERG